MNRTHIFLYIVAMVLLSACRKEREKLSLPPGSISIHGLAAKDTLVREVSIARDTFVIIGLQAGLDGPVATNDHIVTFRPDTARLSAYHARYGNAMALPAENYFFFRSQARIQAGASLSDSIQLNLVTQTSLKPGTVYVLPVTIGDVDGTADAIAPKQVLYIVVKPFE
jgi:BT_3987-like, N-terminal domain